MATKRHGPNTPLWLDLLLGAGFVGLAYGVDRVVGTYRGDPRLNPPLPHRNGAGRLSGNGGGEDDFDATSGEGAIGTRPSQEPSGLQHARARDRGRGRRATNPAQIPAKGWKDILWRTYTQIGADRLLAVGAGAVFYLLLAMFPAITAFVSSYGLFADTGTIAGNLSALSSMMPAGALGIVEEQVTRLTQTSDAALGFGFFFGLALAIWSANAGMKAIIDALNVVYDESEKRGFVTLNLVSLGFTLGALVFLAVALGAVVILPLVLSWFGFESGTAQVLAALRWPALLLAILVWLAVLYRYGPSRREAKWRWLSVGSLFATVTWLGGSALFSWYLSNFADYDATYGSLGAAIGLMMWLWLSVIVILVGAELNAEIEHQTARDSTIGAEKPLGSRGAVMADTLGETWS